MRLANGEYRRPNLRNGNINYRDGWFFVTFQVAENKSELGAIVGERCVLNALGEAVQRLIKTLPDFNPEVYVDKSVVMPNHVHLILRLRRGAAPSRPENNGAAPSRPESNGAAPSRLENNLGRIVGKLKSLAAREYRLLKERGLARDIGSKLWQANYWEKIITTHDQLEAIRHYIEANPKNWSTDRFGPVTTFSKGNLELLNDPFVAFVASQEASVEGLKPKRWRGATPSRPENIEATPSRPENILERGAVAPRLRRPIISTFTSPQEREMLRRALMKGRRLIAIYPGGIPERLSRDLVAALEHGAALLLSPVESGTGVNKQRAVWCNEYLIRRAEEVWCGDIKRGGTLESILKGTLK